MTLTTRFRYAAAAALCLVPLWAHAQTAATSSKSPKKDDYDKQLAYYLEAARRPPVPPPTQATWMTGLALDTRARQVNDLVTIRILESVAAANTADSTLTKSVGANAAVSPLFGLEAKVPGVDLSNMVGLDTTSDFSGTGATSRSSELSASITARVVEVLPNGDLYVEGVREVQVNGDRQVIVITGVVRPFDVRPGNVVFSPSVGQMQIRYFGRGFMKDSLSPGWLARILNKIF
jgi:flagellar L-ring protein precursor FlgH